MLKKVSKTVVKKSVKVTPVKKAYNQIKSAKVEKPAETSFGQAVSPARIDELKARARQSAAENALEVYKRVEKKFVGNERGKKFLYASDSALVSVKAPSTAEINKAERKAAEKVSKKDTVVVEKVKDAASRFKYEEGGWLPVKGRQNAFDAQYFDLWGNDEARYTGFVKFDGEWYDLRMFEKVKKGSSSEIKQYELTLERAGVEVTLIVFSD